MAKLTKDFNIKMDDGRILSLNEAEHTNNPKDRKEIKALIESDVETTVKIFGTFGDTIDVLLGLKPKKPVRMVVRKHRKME